MEHSPEVTKRLAADLAKLNPGEREVLLLLGDGHTAKSISSLTGRSVTSVNERLRQARRKTGVASSRELARLLKTPKNGDEEIGMAAEPSDSPSAPRTVFKRGAMMMIVSTVIVAAVWAAVQQGGAPAPQALPSPQTILPGGLFPPMDSDPRHLAEAVRSEPRDAIWASRAEAALRARYAPLISRGEVTDLRVTCATTACEAVGKIAATDPVRINPIMQTLQDGKANVLAPEAKLENISLTFGPELFASHWKRKG